MDANTLILVTVTLEIIGLGITLGGAILRFYTKTIEKFQNHEDRLEFMERRLDRIEKKIDRINGNVEGKIYFDKKFKEIDKKLEELDRKIVEER